MDLLERAPLLEALERLLGQAANGHGSLLFLGGEAGAGKTSLIREFCRASAQTATVLEGACDALSTPRPLGPLLDIAALLGGELDRLLRQAAPRDHVFGTFLRLISSGLKPNLVVFEDVHWADQATLDLLRYLGRRLATSRTLLVASYRDDELGAAHPLRVVLGDLATAAAIQRLAVPPLSEEAVRLLVAGHAVDARALYQVTAGNPFFVTEVLAAENERMPATVRDAVSARVARLPAAGRTLLETAAVIGSPIAPVLLTSVLGGTLEAAEACIAVGILRAQGPSLSFRHELARQVVLESIPAWRRTALHGRVLKALTRASWDEDQLATLAHHAEGAGDGQAVLTYAPAAARRAAILRAHREAAAQYARALRWGSGLPPSDRAALLEAYAYECYLTDRHHEALRARQEALSIWRQIGDRRKEGETLRWLSRLHWYLGQGAAAAQAGQAAVAVLESLPAGSELAMSYSNQSQLAMLAQKTDAAIAWGEKAMALAEANGDVATLSHALNNVGTARLDQQDDEGWALLERSLALARRHGLEEHVARALTNRASHAAKCGDITRAGPYLEEGIAYCTEHDLDSWFLYMLGWRATLRLLQGRWTEATTDAAVVLRNPRAAPVSRIVALVVIGRVRARRGDAEVWPALDEALTLAAGTEELQRLAPVYVARSEAAWLAGDHARARDEAGPAFELAVRLRETWLAGELAVWSRRGGGHDAVPSWIASPFSLQIDGRWQEAAAAWQDRGCPYEAALALGDGNDENALRRATAMLEDLGARPAAQILTRRLRELGARGIPRGPRPSTRNNPARLTNREVEVLALAAEGLRDAEIGARLYLSPKTVGHHISAALAKLGARTRMDAVREARRLGILGQDGEAGQPI